MMTEATVSHTPRKSIATTWGRTTSVKSCAVCSLASATRPAARSAADSRTRDHACSWTYPYPKASVVRSQAETSSCGVGTQRTTALSGFFGSSFERSATTSLPASNSTVLVRVIFV